MPLIRSARPGDAGGILDIYAPYIERTSFTFETETPSIEQFSERIRTYLINYPWLIYEDKGMIAGYAYAARHRERTAYQWSVESSIYIHPDYMRSGIGRKLYEGLISLLKIQGFRNVYAVINLPNDKSVAFHERCGFLHFTTYEKVGYKLGKWKNVGWWRLVINEFTDDPAAPIPFSQLNDAVINEILQTIR
jgi:phosphinothricin acetyltransferase